MALCPHCMEQKDLFATHCPHCTQKADVGRTAGFNVMGFVIQIFVFWLIYQLFFG
jgi:predicted amidophosphoribosyltransferase